MFREIKVTLAGFFAVVMVLCAVPVTAFALETVDGGKEVSNIGDKNTVPYMNSGVCYEYENLTYFVDCEGEIGIHCTNMSTNDTVMVYPDEILALVGINSKLYALSVIDETKSVLIEYNTLTGVTKEIESFDYLMTTFSVNRQLLYYYNRSGVIEYNPMNGSKNLLVEADDISLLYFVDESSLRYYRGNARCTYSIIEEKTLADDVATLSAVSYVPRLKAPSTSDKHYITISGGGLNRCTPGSNGGTSCLPNCVGYAWGRSYENLGMAPNLCTNQAEIWLVYNIKNGYYPYSTSRYAPALGAVAVWSKGDINNYNDGEGHVAVVEVIDGNTIITSESGYNYKYWYQTTRNLSSSTLDQGSAYAFEGYIYVCGTADESDTVSVPSGTYSIRTLCNTSKALDVDPSVADTFIWDTNSNDTQKWIIEPVSGYYKIINAQTGLALDVKGGTAASGTQVQQYKYNGSAAQMWQFLDAGNGNYYIRSALGYYLDLNGAITDNGNKIYVYNLNDEGGRVNQTWSLVTVSTTPSTPTEPTTECDGWLYTQYNDPDGEHSINADAAVGNELGTIPTEDGSGCGYVVVTKYSSDRKWGYVSYKGVTGWTRLYEPYIKYVSDYTCPVVTFNANGGSVSTSSIKVYYNANYGDLPTPTRAGYNFDGWFTSADGSTQITKGSVVLIESNQTLYAHWTPNETYTTYFDANGGTGAPAPITAPLGSIITIGNQIPERYGYEFCGWWLQGTEGLWQPGYEWVVYENVTFLAYWAEKAKYYVNFNANGGNGGPNYQSKYAGETITITGEQPTRTGYTFLGWSASQNGGIDYYSGSPYVNDSSVTLYAVWERTTPGQPTISVASTEITEADSLQVYWNNVANCNYFEFHVFRQNSDERVFVDWNTPGTSYSVQLPAGSYRVAVAAINSEVEGNSSWTYSDWINFTVSEKYYTISYNANGGENAPAAQTKRHGQNVTITTDVPTRAGYTFKGWAGTLESGVELVPGQICDYNYSWTFFAVWEKITSGTAGNLSWRIEGDTLYISGSGDINYSTAPWDGEIFDDVVIEEGITSIGRGVFKSSNVKSVVFPHSLKVIEDFAFIWCSSLKSIVMKEGLETIGDFAFEKCGLVSVVIPDSVTFIGDDVFNGCSDLIDVTISKNTERIGYSTFQNCSKLVKASIPSSVSQIESNAFSGCESLSSVDIPNSIKRIGDNAFVNCTSMKDIYFDGTEIEWNRITINSGNELFKSATVHFLKTAGDTNSDGTLDAEDLRAYLRALCGAGTLDVTLCDIDGDGRVGLSDLCALAKMLED